MVVVVVGGAWLAWYLSNQSIEFSQTLLASDQGLLYHYTKYMKKSVSIILGETVVENWGPSPYDGPPQLLARIPNPLPKRRQLYINNQTACAKFICDFVHFSGRKKPWVRGRPPANYSAVGGAKTKNNDPYNLWWHTLYELNSELAIGIDFDKDWVKGRRPVLGFFAKIEDMDRRVRQQQPLSRNLLSSDD